jgi:hypothetical protein
VDQLVIDRNGGGRRESVVAKHGWFQATREALLNETSRDIIGGYASSKLVPDDAEDLGDRRANAARLYDD